MPLDACAALALASHDCTMCAIPVIDAHTHFYDPTRPQGVPWPRPDERLLYRAVLPRDFLAQAEPEGCRETVVVEASGWLQDNDWILELASHASSIVGFVGHVEPGEEFAGEIERLAARKLFRGIRLSGSHLQPGALEGTTRAAELCARRGLTLDLLVAAGQLSSAAAIAARLPELKVVIDHLGGVRIDGKSPPAAWLDGMASLAACPRVFCKVSGFVEAADRRPGPVDPAHYRPALDAVLRLFGSGRLVFGSNWPVCELGGSYATVVAIARAFAAAHPRELGEGMFRGNAVIAYGLAKRGR